MVASGLRTVIAGSLSSCVAGFRQSCRFLTIIRPETLVRWHRAGFRRYQVSLDLSAMELSFK
jgi:hypothetical protein